jgi:uncharacterized membrane protein
MKYLVERFREPSSWAGIAILITVLTPLMNLPSGFGDAFIQLGTAVAAFVAVFLKEEQ